MNCRNERGWILIDGLVTTVIVAIALTTLAMAFTQGTKSSIAATNYTEALHLAQSTIENFKQHDLTATVPTASTVTAGIYTIAVAMPTVNEVQYLNTSQQKLLPLQVTVSWTEGGSNRSVTVTSYYVTALAAGELQ